ncbi:MAG: transaldolase family protein [Anaerolineae bacterium]|jgi:transaldolase|nr:transaldolase family protein [Anaerolineae bacterium]
MDIFLDTANIDEIRKAAEWGILSGVTTNPSLMMKAGQTDYKAVAQEICYIVQGPVSAEVIRTDADGMVEEAKVIGQWSPHVVVKVPVTEEGLKATYRIAQLDVDTDRICDGCPYLGKCDTDIDTARDLAEAWGIRTNATLVFSANQGLLAAKAGASFVSPFIGRLDDAGHDGMEVVRNLAEIFDTYGIDTEIIAASIRHPLHITQAALAGADIATVPFAVLSQAIKHPLTDVGVQRFLADWEKAKKGK